MLGNRPLSDDEIAKSARDGNGATKPSPTPSSRRAKLWDNFKQKTSKLRPRHSIDGVFVTSSKQSPSRSKDGNRNETRSDDVLEHSDCRTHNTAHADLIEDLTGGLTNTTVGRLLPQCNDALDNTVCWTTVGYIGYLY